MTDIADSDSDPLVVVPLRLRSSTIAKMKEAISSGRYTSEADIARKAIDIYLIPMCGRCGQVNLKIADYCQNCGTPLREQAR